MYLQYTNANVLNIKGTCDSNVILLLLQYVCGSLHLQWIAMRPDSKSFCNFAAISGFFKWL